MSTLVEKRVGKKKVIVTCSLQEQKLTRISFYSYKTKQNKKPNWARYTCHF